jgi:pyruvate dehydrogenase E1 component beta subunit
MAVKTYAQAVCDALSEAMHADANVVALGEDVGRGGIFGQYRGLQQTFGPMRVIDTPISESTIMGAAVGMALAGLKPVVEMRVADFAMCAMDELINQAAKARYMFGGQGRVPLVARLPIGIWSASAAQHSQSFEAWFAHVPGLVVIAPATPADNAALLRASIECGDPVVYMEHKELWGVQGEVDPAARVPLGKATVVRQGRDLTLVTWSRALHASLEAADALAKQGIEVEVIDLRTLWPWDREAVFASAARTGRLLIVHEAIQAAGFGAEIAATVAEELGIPVHRLGGPRIPVGYSRVLEDEARLTAAKIVTRIADIIQRKHKPSARIEAGTNGGASR